MISFGGSCSDIVWKSSDCSGASAIVREAHMKADEEACRNTNLARVLTWLLPPQPTPAAVEPKPVVSENGCACSGPMAWKSLSSCDAPSALSSALSASPLDCTAVSSSLTSREA